MKKKTGKQKTRRVEKRDSFTRDDFIIDLNKVVRKKTRNKEWAITLKP